MGNYPCLANSMAKHLALQVFRWFSALNLRSILYYEAELARLHNELEEVEKLDSESDQMPRKVFGRSWQALTLTSTLAPDDASPASNAHRSDVAATKCTHSHQWDVMCRIRTVLEAYCE